VPGLHHVALAVVRLHSALSLEVLGLLHLGRLLWHVLTELLLGLRRPVWFPIASLPMNLWGGPRHLLL
jgi:hypothetical protein